MTEPLFDGLLAPEDRVALIVGEERLSYRELARACAAHLARLRAHGVRVGDRVGTWTHPTMGAAVALVAHAAGGLVSVPLSPTLGATELAHLLRDARPAAIVGEDARTPEAIAARVETDGRAELPALAADASPALVLYTSGTTGPPKGAELSRRNIAFDLDGLRAAWALTPDDTIVHALPLFHVHGLVLGLFGALRAGAALHLHARFEPGAIAKTLAPGGTVLYAVPTMYHRLADAAERDPSVAAGLSRARLLVSGSAGLPVREHRRIEAVARRGVLERYGLTETLINCAVRAASGPRPGSVGPPLDGVSLRLVDDAGRPIDAHDDATIGEVSVRGDNVFCGYVGRPEATAAVLDADGWFSTGDLATRAADGAIRIVGRRATDLIKTGGFKVGAGEVEAALLEAPGVAEVAVLGVEDEDLGERIVAFVVVAREGAAPSAEALIERVATELAPHKRPREVRFVDALPRNAMGKVVKAKLRDA